MSNDEGKLNKSKVSQPSLFEAADTMQRLDDAKNNRPNVSIIPHRVRLPMDKVDSALSYWRPHYFGTRTEGRLLNGVEAYELGDEKKRQRPNKVPYIAMCNLMALEALKMMGDSMPTVEAPEELAIGTDRERLIADFWKKTFACTDFQANWAWSAVLAILVGEPGATEELLYKYQEQMPDMIITL